MLLLCIRTIFQYSSKNTMRKNKIISIALAASMAIAIPAIASPEVCAVDSEQVCTEVAIEAATATPSEGVAPSQELSTMQKSEIARKQKQAEKAKNAAENDKHGFAITIIAMSIVLSALIILSILFLVFGKISEAVQKYNKRKAHGITADSKEELHDELDSGEVIAAISMALAEHEGYGHDMEDTILTIKRMRKAYSPWNSKIYNMRYPQEHSKAKPTGH